MDLDIIIFAVIWILVIGYSVITSKIKQEKEKMKNDEALQSRQRELQNIFEQIKNGKSKSTSSTQTKKDIQNVAEKKAQPLAKPIIAEVPKLEPINYQIAEEGQRVTRTKPKSEPTPAEKTGLHNKENLKRAIIFGEILQPKF